MHFNFINFKLNYIYFNNIILCITDEFINIKTKYNILLSNLFINFIQKLNNSLIVTEYNNQSNIAINNKSIIFEFYKNNQYCYIYFYLNKYIYIFMYLFIIFNKNWISKIYY